MKNMYSQSRARAELKAPYLKILGSYPIASK